MADVPSRQCRRNGFYVMSTDGRRTHAAEFEGYDFGKGSIRFPTDKQLPTAFANAADWTITSRERRDPRSTGRAIP